MKSHGKSLKTEWDYLDCMREQYMNKVTSQAVRQKNLNDRKSAVKIRDSQLEFNESRFSQRNAEEVKLRVEAHLANRPELPPPALFPLFVALYTKTTTGKPNAKPDDWVTSRPGWDRYLNESFKSKIEVFAFAAADRK